MVSLNYIREYSNDISFTCYYIIMEKLIELLNEYENRDDDQQIEWRIWEWDKWENGKVRWIVNDVYMWWVSELVVCSAYYWFIEWLVENDKIETNKLKKIWYEKTIYWYDWQYREIVEYSDYESLLMMLSISNTPIADLVSYLK